MKSFILFIALLCMWLYMELKISKITTCIAFKESQTRQETLLILFMGFLSVIAWTFYASL